MHHEFTVMMPHKTFKKLKSTAAVVVETVNVAMQFQSAHKGIVIKTEFQSLVPVFSVFSNVHKYGTVSS